MATALSPADRELIAKLESEGLTATAEQLAGWRRRGLLPRTSVRRAQFGGSEALPHGEEVFEVAAVLARCSRRGRPWQMCGSRLFEEGWTLSTEALRQVALFELEAAVRPYRRAWKEAQIGVMPAEDPLEWIADVATAAARRISRIERGFVRQEVAAAQPYLSAQDLKQAVQTALAWRTADINVPGYLTAEQRNLARHGSPEPPDVLRTGFFVLPSERAACIANLTWAEAFLARQYLQIVDPPQLEVLSMLTLATSWVTARRMEEDFAHPDRALTGEQLSALVDRLDAELNDEDTSGGTTPLPFPD